MPAEPTNQQPANRSDARSDAARSPITDAAGPHYDLIAIDIDGTLLDHNGHIHERTVRAIHAARTAGVRTVLCTGRALIECKSVMERLGQVDPIIASGGAIVTDPVTGDSLERSAMPEGLVRDVADHLLAEEHPALLLKDAAIAGVDYVVVSPWGPEALDPASRWWFDHMNVKHRFVPHYQDDEHPEHTIRVGAYSANEPVDGLAGDLRTKFGSRAMLQHFQGVMLPPSRRAEGIHSIHIVEVFSPDADKWKALSRLANRMGVPLIRTAAIGDQTNDLTMIQHAGLGIAMGGSHPSISAAAKRQTLSASEGGVGYAIEQILSGAW